MKAIREIEFHEFREHLESYLQSGETIVVMQYGRRVGTFAPTIPRRVESVESSEPRYFQALTPEESRAKWAAFEKASARLDALVEKYGITEDEAIEEFERLRRESRNAGR